MKKIIKIKIKTQNYNIVVENKSILNNIVKEAKLDKKIFIIIDKNVKSLIANLPKKKNINIIKTDSGEKIKSIDYFSEISSKLLKLKIDRSSTIIAIGGGTIGDLSGFIASTILRGVRFILIPTTLLAQVDSSIGGKNGINTSFGKNLIGTFLQPNLVIIDPSTLVTLPKREMRSGYSEILKHALIKDKIFYKWLNANHNKVINLNSKFITEAIIKSIKIKAFFVQKDEKEKLIDDSSRAMLNFGHTFGHALELMNQYSNKLSHGEAVSVGMALAAKVSKKLNLITVQEYDDLILHLKKVKLPYYDKRIKDDLLYKLMLSDKKNSNDKINLILLKKIGKGYFKRGLDIEEIKKLLN
jgi:shikimate kinase/3-dehydroquinate synthase